MKLFLTSRRTSTDFHATSGTPNLSDEYCPNFLRPSPAHVILGGPQVMHKAESYLDLLAKLVLCNGEGEFTFVQYLEQLIAESLICPS